MDIVFVNKVVKYEVRAKIQICQNHNNSLMSLFGFNQVLSFHTYEGYFIRQGTGEIKSNKCSKHNKFHKNRKLLQAFYTPTSTFRELRWG